MNHIIEFYDVSTDTRITTVGAGMVPPVGAYVNIAQESWVVIRVTYTVDYSGMELSRRVLCAIVELKRANDVKVKRR